MSITIRPLLIPLLATATSCTDPVQRHIDTVVTGGDEADEAKMELSMAKPEIIPPLVAAFGDQSHPLAARKVFAEAIFRQLLHRMDSTLLEALTGGLADPNVEIRATTARLLGHMNKVDLVEPLLVCLEQESESEVTSEVLSSMETLLGHVPGGFATTAQLSEEQYARFQKALLRTAKASPPEALRLQVREWLEAMSHEMAIDAQTMALKGNVSEAEQILQQALELVPDSKNINLRLGRLYLGNDDRNRGLQVLREHGLALTASLLPTRPVIDGVLDDDVWQDLEPVTGFYLLLPRLAPHQAEGQTEAYVGYVGDDLYVAFRGFEDSTEALVITATERDSHGWRDDNVEVHIDTNFDQKTFYMFQSTPNGTMTDVKYADNHWVDGAKDYAWNSTGRVAAAVDEEFWTAELEIPADELRAGGIRPGDIWGLNMVRTRIGFSEYTQWVPTYGNSGDCSRYGVLLFQ